MNTASQLDINWPHPRGHCVSVSHITLWSPPCVTTSVSLTPGSLITECESSATATPWLGLRRRTDLWTELVLGDAAACVYTLRCTPVLLSVYKCTLLYRQHMWSHSALYTINNTPLPWTGHTEIYRLAHRIFPRSYLHASDNDDHLAIKRKSHTGFTFLWRQ